jgi:RNA polymerase sigma-70 factor (ECF subfamily)
MHADGSDAELALRIAAAPGVTGAEEAALYRRFARRIELYGRRHLGSASAAQDLVQQVIVKVLEALRAGRLANPDALASFVLGTCRNVTWDTRRAEQRQRKLERAGGELDAVSEPLAGRSLEERDVLRLFGCMNRLPEREASVVRMSFWEDQSADVIAQRIGASAGNVRVLRHRALGKLSKCMHSEQAP